MSDVFLKYCARIGSVGNANMLWINFGLVFGACLYRKKISLMLSSENLNS